MNQLVKFSQDEAPSDEDCHRLLMEYMPDFIQKTKITQRLFIKSAIPILRPVCYVYVYTVCLPSITGSLDT